MNFTFTEEESMLESLALRLFARNGAHAPARSDQDIWASMAAVGLLGLQISDTYGGNAQSTHDSAVGAYIVAKAMGHALVDAPFAASAVMVASLLEECASESLKQQTLSAMASGQLRIVPGHDEGARDTGFAYTATTARATADGHVLRGGKRNVVHAHEADRLVVSARTGGTANDENGISLFLIDRRSAGVRIVPARGLEADVSASEVWLDDVAATREQLLGTVGCGLEPMRRAIHRGIAALLAEAVGGMERLLEMSIEHLKTRRQFNQPLARFQALQHHIADMATSIEQSDAMALMAAKASTSEDGAYRSRLLSAAKAFVCRQALGVAKTAIQLHGGMGMTEELAAGRHFRRLLAIDGMWGKGSDHLAAFSRTGPVSWP